MGEKFYQTQTGRSRLLDELAALKKNEEDYERARSNHRKNLGRGHADGDECINLDNDLVICITRTQEIMRAFSESSGIAPEPTTTKTVQLNSIVTVKKFADDNDDVGKLYTFQVVGHGEGMAKGSGTGNWPDLPLISYTCSLGAAVLKKRKGAGVTVNGKDMEIVNIELPSSPARAANAA